jgi:two-component system, NtrC family, response regulator AtoC
MKKRPRPLRILIIEDEPILLVTVRDWLSGEGYTVHTEKTGTGGLQAFREKPFDMVLLDLVMPGLDGLQVLEQIRTTHADMPVLIMTAHGTVETAVKAMKLGSSEFLTKPFRLEELSARLKTYADLIRLKEENVRLKSDLGEKPIIGQSHRIRDVLHQVSIVAATHSTVLILGESGTGKELIARGIHDQSPHCNGRFVKVSCPALPETLLEAELFGHEKGAFTGAHQKKVGRFELADEGTIFLDEIGDITPMVQVKLLRVLQEHSFERVGGTQTIHPHTRVVCATRFDLKQLVDEGKFREDLFYRLNVVTITAPQLVDRPEDIPVLADHFRDRANFNMGKQVEAIAPSCMKLLQNYSWPGNVRELENAIERAVMFCQARTVTVADLSPEIRSYRENLLPCPDEFDLSCNVRETERQCIIRALHQTGGNRSQASKLLGISRKRLWEKMKEMQVNID